MEKETSFAKPHCWKRQAIAILFFAIAFGYVEAAVVTYLRPQFYEARAALSPQSSRDNLFPLLTLQQVKAAGPNMVKLVGTEIAREAATIIMLGMVAAAVGGNFRQGLAYFLLAFGTWDIAFYGFLKVLIDWPKSLLTWDILFLLPVPWSGPVLAPVLVALTMVAAGLVYLWRDANGHAVRLKGVHWLCACAGTVFVLAAFTWDYRNVMAGGMPGPFHWPVFALGEVVWVAALVYCLGRTRA